LNLDLTADQILEVPIDNPERLFSEKEIKQEYHSFLKKWYLPAARNEPKANQVMMRLRRLYEVGTDKIKYDTWEEPGIYRIVYRNGDITRFRYTYRYQNGPDEIVTDGNMNIWEIIPESSRDLIDNQITVINSLRFLPVKLRVEFEHKVPSVVPNTVNLDSGKFAYYYQNNMHALKSVVEYTHIAPEHVAWILSELYNLNCFFAYSGVCHNNLSLKTVFIDPDNHAVRTPIGWHYSALIGKKIPVLLSHMVPLVPSQVLANKIADHRIDLNSVRSIARELLGITPGNSRASELQPMRGWLMQPTSGNPYQDYKEWEVIREQTFGPRKFTKWDFNLNDFTKFHREKVSRLKEK
jgi:hypothetical protein